MSVAFGQFLSVWALLAVNILSPGPNVINTIATAMGSGRAAGLGSAAGVGLGIAVWCLGMSLGASALFVAWPQAQTLLGVVAIGLLLWFSQRYLAGAGALLRGARLGVAEPVRMGVGASFRRSLAVNATNPKALTSWLAILGIFPTAQAGASDIALLTLGACTIAVTIHVAYAILFSSPAAARLYARIAWAVMGGAGLFFLCFAANLAWSLVAPAP
ncbi:MAG: LysE family transporter [Rhodobacteraceae bacterium]|jgi:threonine/homoserine/homoserine lactone efflux protein|nr:LysE family transporter [Paracoccaceae bacterium]